MDRYARAVDRGRYLTMTDAARDYMRELESRPSSPRERRLTVPRTLSAVTAALSERARTLGLSRPLAHWSEEESRLLDRFVRRAVRDLNYSAGRAARAYLRAADRERKKHPYLPGLRVRRGFRAVRSRVGKCAREQGRPRLRAKRVARS